MARTLFKSWFVDFNPVRAKAEGRQPSGMDAETVKLFPSEFEESELGEIPKGWRVGTIADCGLVITGKTPSKADPSLFSSTYPFIKIPDMHGCLWITSTQDGLSEAGHLVQSSKLVPPKSVAVSCIATVGLVSLIRRASHTNQQINTVVPSSTTSWAWLFFALRELVPEIEARSLGGSVTKNLNKGQFEAIPVLLPPAPVQRVFEQVVGDLLGLVAARDDESGRLRSVRDQLLPQLLSGELSVASAQQMEGAK
jgi:type I restriction enzyme S subunit